MSAPACKGCGSGCDRQLLRAGCPFCTGCWSQVPEKARKALKKAAGDLARWPSSSHVRAGHDLATREAIAHARGRP